ncbi:MAG: GntR family transcriptional regulator [Lachnospiraceae bacterium]|nr:GntR family transcriptional regulator [Lachnospiraceae bacterium]
MTISSKKPLYYQLKQTILKWIENGEYAPGELLPSEKQLQEIFHISRTTVRLALKELAQEGFLIRSPGKGTFVACMKMESGPRRLLSFTQEMLDMGLGVSSQIISVEKEYPAARTANKLQISQEQPVWRLERIRLADTVPIVTEVNYIPSSPVRQMDMNLVKNRSFYEFLEQEYGIVIVYAREKVECRLADTRESRHLNISKGSPILHVERLTFGYRKNRPMESFPVEFVKMSYNAKKYSFHQIIRKE